MRKILFLLLLLISFRSFGQTDVKAIFFGNIPPQPRWFAYTPIGVWTDSTLKLTKYKPATIADTVLIGLDTGGRAYKYDVQYLKNLASSGGLDTTGHFIGIGWLAYLMKYSDTATLIPTKFQVDTAKTAIRAEIAAGGVAIPSTEVPYGTGVNITSEPLFKYNPTTNKLSADTTATKRIVQSDTTTLSQVYVREMFPGDYGYDYGGYSGRGGAHREGWGYSYINGSGRPDIVWHRDYNIKNSVREFNDEAAWFDNWETYFEQGGRSLIEHLVGTVDTLGNSRRHFAMYADRNDNANTWINSAVTRWEWYSQGDIAGQYASIFGDPITESWYARFGSPLGTSGIKFSNPNNDTLMYADAIPANQDLYWRDWRNIIFGGINFTPANTTGTGNYLATFGGLAQFQDDVSLQRDWNGITRQYIWNLHTGSSASALLDFRNNSGNSFFAGLKGTNYSGSGVIQGGDFYTEGYAPISITTFQFPIRFKASLSTPLTPDFNIDSSGQGEFRKELIVPPAINDNEAVNLGQMTTAINPTFQTLTDADTIEWDMVTSPYAQVILGGNRVLRITNQKAWGTLLVFQDATGGRTLTLPPNSKIAYGETFINLSDAAGSIDELSFHWNGVYTTWQYATSFAGDDPDVDAVMAKIADNGCSLTGTEETALSQMVTAFKIFGYWDRFRRIGGYIGGTADCHKINFKDTADTDAAFRLDFQGGWTHDATGSLPNGSTGYANTFFDPSTEFDDDSMSIGVYLSTENTNYSDKYMMGCATSGSNVMGIISHDATTAILNWFSSANDITLAGAIEGFYAGSGDLTDKVFYRNSTASSPEDVSGSGAPNLDIYIGALNLNNTSYGHTNGTISFDFIGEYFSPAEMANIYQIILTYQTTLGRN